MVGRGSWAASMRALVAALALVAGGVGSARADDAAQARELYQKATAHYGLGEYEEAANAYQDAYKAKPDAALLFNAAQSFRLAGRLEKALLLYRNYVRLYPGAANVDEVRARVAKMDEQIAADKARVGVPPPPPRAADLPSTPVTPSAASDASFKADVHQDQRDRNQDLEAPRPLTRRPWFWVAVGGAVALVVGIGVAAVSGERSSWSNVMDVQQAQRSGGQELVRW